MNDHYRTTFVVDIAPDEIWEALVERVAPADGDGNAVHYVLPGFPSMVPVPLDGAQCTVLEEDPGRLLRVRKDHHPCQGTEIAVSLEHVDTGTRMTVVQSGFGPFMDFVGRDVVFAHGDQIATDFRLYLERRITVPGTVWGADLGALPVQTPVGIVLGRVNDGGFAERAGMQHNDLLLTLHGIRIHDVAQLFTVMALIDPRAAMKVTWARGNEVMRAQAAALV